MIAWAPEFYAEGRAPAWLPRPVYTYSVLYLAPLSTGWRDGDEIALDCWRSIDHCVDKKCSRETFWIGTRSWYSFPWQPMDLLPSRWDFICRCGTKPSFDFWQTEDILSVGISGHCLPGNHCSDNWSYLKINCCCSVNSSCSQQTSIKLDSDNQYPAYSCFPFQTFSESGFERLLIWFICSNIRAKHCCGVRSEPRWQLSTWWAVASCKYRDIVLTPCDSHREL